MEKGRHESMRTQRRARILAAAVAALGIFVSVSLATVRPVYAGVWQDIDDTCNQGGANSTQFYADGPPQYWTDATYTGGPDPCMMWTWNETSYTNQFVGNEAYWYNCIGTCTSYYYLYPFIPAVNATTVDAQYQIWEGGHLQSQPTYVCGVNQNAIYNSWVELCSNVAPQWMCGSTSCGGFVLLQDGTGESNGTTQVGYDNLIYSP